MRIRSIIKSEFNNFGSMSVGSELVGSGFYAEMLSVLIMLSIT